MKRYRIYLCGVDEPLVEDPCPGGHDPAPAGYIAWHDWAATMGKTHRQRRCEVCGLFGIWELKKVAS